MGGCLSSQKPEEAAVTGCPAPAKAKPAAPANPDATPVGTGGGHAPSDASSSKVVEQPPQQLQVQLDVPVQQPAPKPESDSASSIDAVPPRPSLSPSSGNARFAPNVLPAPSPQAAAIGKGALMSRGSSFDSSSSDVSTPGDGSGICSNESSQPPASDLLMNLLVSRLAQQQQLQAQLGRGITGEKGAAAGTPAGGSMFDQSAQPGDLTDARTRATGGATTALRRASALPGYVTSKALTIPFSELEIMKQVGEGSSGRVYMAKWRESLVAVKLLLNTGGDVEDMEAAADLAMSLSNPVLLNLEKEASLMAALRHPNIVGFLGVCPTPPCVVSDFCSRGSLNDVLRAAKQYPAKAAQLDWVRRLNMALDAAKGMLYLHLHSPPIIHSHLKSSNLLVDKHWMVKVCDCNLSKIMGDSSEAYIAPNNSRWLAPEVLNRQPATLASDVYSFGVVLWEMLTLELPWGRCNQREVMKLVSEGQRLQVPARSALPPSSQGFEGLDLYEELIHKCWAEDPKDRPTFAEVIGYLRLGRKVGHDSLVPAEQELHAQRKAQHAKRQPNLHGQHAPHGQPSMESEPRPQSELVPAP
ncbi:hypothetical protein N2152v2_010489 [Parachlorella kessleri]